MLGYTLAKAGQRLRVASDMDSGADLAGGASGWFSIERTGSLAGIKASVRESALAEGRDRP